MYALTTHFQSTDASFLGGLLVLFGTAALLMHFGFLPAIALWKLWPLILVWGGVQCLLERRLGGLLSILFGGTLLAYYFDWLPSPLEWQLLWPLGVIALGLRLWAGGGDQRREGDDRDPRDAEFDRKEAGLASALGASSEPPLRVELLMAGREQRWDGRVFAGASIRCRLAGYELDLRGATPAGDELVVDVEVLMGGIELRVPRSWRVEVDASPVLGGIDDQTTCAHPEGAPRLIVRGKILLGGVELRN